MSHIEFVMEVHGSLSEVPLNFGMESKSCLDDGYDLFLNGSLELGEMLAQEGVVNGEERSLLGEGNGEGPEMSLKSWVNDERTSSWVHASGVLSVLDVL